MISRGCRPHAGESVKGGDVGEDQPPARNPTKIADDEKTKKRGSHITLWLARLNRQCEGSNDNFVVKGDTQNQYKNEDDDEDEDLVDVML